MALVSVSEGGQWGYANAKATRGGTFSAFHMHMCMCMYPTGIEQAWTPQQQLTGSRLATASRHSSSSDW